MKDMQSHIFSMWEKPQVVPIMDKYSICHIGTTKKVYRNSMMKQDNK